MFSESEQKAINEKLEQLTKIKEGSLTQEELTNLITERRINWIKINFHRLLDKYFSLSLEELAYNIIFFEHMKINPKYSKMKRVSKNKLEINSYNFCLYLEACKLLSLDTKFICKEIWEPSIKKMISLIDPHLNFDRDYSHIRPHTPFCKEYIKIKN